MNSKQATSGWDFRQFCMGEAHSGDTRTAGNPRPLKLSRNTIQQRIEFNAVLIQVHRLSVATLLALFQGSTRAIPRLIQFCRSF
jgi:hypothetical protein